MFKKIVKYDFVFRLFTGLIFVPVGSFFIDYLRFNTEAPERIQYDRYIIMAVIYLIILIARFLYLLLVVNKGLIVEVPIISHKGTKLTILRNGTQIEINSLLGRKYIRQMLEQKKLIKIFIHKQLLIPFKDK